MKDTLPDGGLLAQVARIAHEAGQAIAGYYREVDSAVTYKEDCSPLTAADLAAHRIIIEALARLTPDIPALSEESASIPYERRARWSRFWLIDPLDGTKEFIKRNDEFTVNIALIERKRPVLGVVRAPMLGVTYLADAVNGAARQFDGRAPEPIHASDWRTGPLKVIVTRSHRTPEMDVFMARLGPCEVATAGSSLKFMRVAEGAAHLYPRLGPTMEWDTAAAQVVVEAAGGSVTALDGAPLRYNKPDLHNPFFMVAGSPPYPWEHALAGN